MLFEPWMLCLYINFVSDVLQHWTILDTNLVLEELGEVSLTFDFDIKAQMETKHYKRREKNWETGELRNVFI